MDTVFYLMSPIVYLLNIEGIIINNDIGYGLWSRRNWPHLAITNGIMIQLASPKKSKSVTLPNLTLSSGSLLSLFNILRLLDA